MFGGMLIHICHALEYMHFHVFHAFGKSKKIFVYFKASLAKCVLFVLILDIISFGFVYS